MIFQEVLMKKKGGLGALIIHQKKKLAFDKLGRVPLSDITYQQKLNERAEQNSQFAKMTLMQTVQKRMVDIRNATMIRLAQAKHQLDNRQSEAIEDFRNGEGQNI